MPMKPKTFTSVKYQNRDRKIQDYLYDKQREKSPEKKIWNSKRWKTVRNRYIARNPFCEDPFFRHGITVLAVDVDHIVPLSRSVRDAFNPDNLQSLCRACHNKKTASDKAK